MNYVNNYMKLRLMKLKQMIMYSKNTSNQLKICTIILQSYYFRESKS